MLREGRSCSLLRSSPGLLRRYAKTDRLPHDCDSLTALPSGNGFASGSVPARTQANAIDSPAKRFDSGVRGWFYGFLVTTFPFSQTHIRVPYIRATRRARRAAAGIARFTD